MVTATKGNDYIAPDKFPNNKYPYPNPVLGTLNMDPIEKRSSDQPRIYIDGITEPAKIKSVSVLYSEHEKNKFDKLQEVYDKAKAAGELYQEHLVIKIDQDMSPLKMGSVEFNGKVIFIIEHDKTLKVNEFYNSGPNASTLIYAGAGNAAIENFDLPENGNFRGLIYIDDANTAKHTIKLGQTNGGGNIYGAIHNFATSAEASFEWNGSSTKSTNIFFDKYALGAFNTLTCDPSKSNYNDCITNIKQNSGSPTASYIDSTNLNNLRTKLTALGYYFY
jgi:hypothetical protein